MPTTRVTAALGHQQPSRPLEIVLPELQGGAETPLPKRIIRTQISVRLTKVVLHLRAGKNDAYHNQYLRETRPQGTIRAWLPQLWPQLWPSASGILPIAAEWPELSRYKRSPSPLLSNPHLPPSFHLLLSFSLATSSVLLFLWGGFCVSCFVLGCCV